MAIATTDGSSGADAARNERRIAAPKTATRQDLFAWLEYATSHVDVIHALVRGLGLEEKYVAKATGVRTETVSRWLRGESRSIHSRDAINDLRYIALSLLATERLTREGIAYWLSRRDIRLGIEPVEALAAGQFEQVVEAGRAYAEGRGADPGCTATAD